MKKKISLIILSLIMLLSSINLLACQKPEGDENMLTPEQQVQKIREIYSKTYDNYFNENEIQQMLLNKSLKGIVNTNKHISGISEEQFNLMYSIYSVTCQTVVEEKNIEILTKRYTVNTETNLNVQVADKFDESLSNAVSGIINRITDVTIYGQSNNAVYSKIDCNGDVGESIIFNMVIRFINSSDYSITIILPNGGMMKNEASEIMYFNKNTLEMFILGNYEDSVVFCDMKNLTITNLDKIDTEKESEIKELEEKANGFINNFNSTIATFPAKTETEVLMFKWED